MKKEQIKIPVREYASYIGDDMKLEAKFLREIDEFNNKREKGKVEELEKILDDYYRVYAIRGPSSASIHLEKLRKEMPNHKTEGFDILWYLKKYFELSSNGSFYHNNA